MKQWLYSIKYFFLTKNEKILSKVSWKNVSLSISNSRVSFVAKIFIPHILRSNNE